MSSNIACPVSSVIGKLATGVVASAMTFPYSLTFLCLCQIEYMPKLPWVIGPHLLSHLRRIFHPTAFPGKSGFRYCFTPFSFYFLDCLLIFLVVSTSSVSGFSILLLFEDLLLASPRAYTLGDKAYKSSILFL